MLVWPAVVCLCVEWHRPDNSRAVPGHQDCLKEFALSLDDMVHFVELCGQRDRAKLELGHLDLGARGRRLTRGTLQVPSGISFAVVVWTGHRMMS
jgi:hypothetical protein